MELSKIKQKEINKLYLNKERNKQRLFLVFDIASINKAKKLNLLKESYETKDGVVGVVKFLPSKPVSKKIIYLDEIADPHNLGKIIYLMKKYGYHDLMLSPNSVSIYNEKCVMVAKDNIFDINVSYGGLNELKKLKKQGYKILSTGLKSSTLLNKVKTPNSFVLVFGNEARGVNLDVLTMSDIVIKIPISNMDSLNIAVAASIVLDNL